MGVYRVGILRVSVIFRRRNSCRIKPGSIFDIQNAEKFSYVHAFGQRRTLCSKSMKIAVLGAATKTGSCLSLLLKQSQLIDEIVLHDIESLRGVALELDHIDSKCKVIAAEDERCLEETLRGAKIIAIVAGKTFRTNSDEALTANGEILSNLLPCVIRLCPEAMVAIAMSPVNSLVPLAAEMYKRAGIVNYNRLFGVTTLDCVRANSFVAETIGFNPEFTLVPVIGGNCPETCIPLFSHARPCNKLSQEEIYRLTQRVRTHEEQIEKANKGKECSSFARAFAVARFCISLCKALRHQSGVVECAYVRSCIIPEVTYFAAPLELGPDGIQRHMSIPPLSCGECRLLKNAIPVLQDAIQRGEKHADM